MEYRQLGKSGLRVSAIGLGTNQFGGKVDQAGVNNIIDSAIDLGINFIDTADVYTKGQSETTLGVALRGKWHKVVLATKVYNATGEGPNDYGSSRYHIINGVDACLKRLQSEHVDVLQLHRYDATAPLDEILRALDDLVSAGKIRYIGASNYMAWQLAEANTVAEWHGWTRFISVQNHYHMFERDIEREVLPYCKARNVGILPFFPLAGGFLTGKYRRGQAAPAGSRGESSPYVQKYMTDRNYDKVEAMEAWSQERGHTMGDLAHAWLLGHPEVSSVISGATNIDQIKANASSANWKLSADEMAEINKILEG